MLVDGRTRPKSHRLAGGEELEFEPPAPRPSGLVAGGDRAHRPVRGRAPARRGQARRPRRPSGAGPRTGNARARAARVRRRGRGRAGAAGDRAPARPRHVGAARRRPLAGGAPAAAGARAVAAADARVPRPRRRSAALSPRDDRRTDRPRPPRPDAAVARQRHAARGGDALRGARSCCRAMRCSASRWRRGGRTRSASTSTQSTCRWPATRSTAAPATWGCERQFLHAARLAFEHPFTGEPVDVTSPLPADLAAALVAAGGR